MGGTVRGEDRPEQSVGASPRRVRTGPRHAAPKKSVLTRLQVPAGKAIALAAMPSAVLMGMGLTPQLASANPRPEDRYKAGPCVSQPDGADQDDAKGGEGGKDAKGGKDASASGGRDEDAKGDGQNTDAKGGKDTEDTEDAKDTDGSKGSSGKDSGDGSGGASDTKPTPSPSGSHAPSSGGDEKRTEEPSASPSPSPSKNPLGLGDALHDILTPDDPDDPDDPDASDSTDKDTSAEPSASPSPSSSAGRSASPTPSKTSGTSADPVKDTVDKAGKTAKDAKDAAKGEDRTDEASPSPSSSASKGDDGGKEAFPCPEFDAEAYENAETDPAANLLPEDPWILKSTLLTLHGLDYKGIVEVRTQGGRLKKVLKFTASGVDIKDLHQLVVGPAGTTTHVQAREGSTSTIRNGTVTMYTEELSGNLLGLIPITFSPKSPPPVNIPEVFFTGVTVKQAGQFGGDLTVPGMHLFKTGE
ncbi:hydrogenase expression protein HypF [Streptomyces hygroscopicus]|uniref:hydrogenase expression protein HypF n=1 Tax=Streptomyces hygroscopicus TaxID=1912 RepID=UPI0033F86A35